MSVATVRGGVPYVRREAITTTGKRIHMPFYIHFLKIRVDSNPCRLYFTEADFTADENYIEIPIPSASTPYGEWEGPVETCAGDRSDVWLRGVTGSSDVELVGFQRRG